MLYLGDLDGLAPSASAPGDLRDRLVFSGSQFEKRRT